MLGQLTKSPNLLATCSCGDLTFPIISTILELHKPTTHNLPHEQSDKNLIFSSGETTL